MNRSIMHLNEFTPIPADDATWSEPTRRRVKAAMMTVDFI
jgi:hypothetical protein